MSPALRCTILSVLSLASLVNSQMNGTRPPVPTASWPALAPDFIDIPTETQHCWNSYFEYSFTHDFLVSEYHKSTTRIVTTFKPPRSRIMTYSYNDTTDCSTTIFGSTSLCDNIPRASNVEINCRTVTKTGIVEWNEYQSDITTIAPTWTRDFAKPQPTCIVAPDLSPLCRRLFDAWQYRTSQFSSVSLASSEAKWREYNAIPNCTPLLELPDPTAKPICKIRAGSYSAYHWPSPSMTGPDICQLDGATPAGIPAITGKPSTAVISGLTLTSPSVYHILKDVKVEKYAGFAAQPGGLGASLPYSVWNVSTVAPILTVAQLEENILSFSKSCRGREMDYCTVYFDPGFRIHDISFVRSSAYEKNCKRCLSGDGGVIYQNKYKPNLAIAVREIQEQNGGIFSDCEWMNYESNEDNGWRSYTTSSIVAVLVTNVSTSAFVPVTTTESVVREAASPGLVGSQITTTQVPPQRAPDLTPHSTE